MRSRSPARSIYEDTALFFLSQPSLGHCLVSCMTRFLGSRSQFSAFMHDLRGLSAAKSRDTVEKTFSEATSACKGDKARTPAAAARPEIRLGRRQAPSQNSIAGREEAPLPSRPRSSRRVHCSATPDTTRQCRHDHLGRPSRGIDPPGISFRMPHRYTIESSPAVPGHS